MSASAQPFGEFALIDRIVARLGDAAARDILVPPGDDAAAWRTTEGVSVATTDLLVEGTHFRADTMSRADVGWRAIAANVSDIAAMGATPRFALIGLVLPPGAPLEAVDCLVDGMAECCRATEVRIAGGDIVQGVRGAGTMVAVTLLGEAPRDAHLLRRDGAQAGDAVATSGVLGAAAAGLAVIEAARADEVGVASLVAAHRRPRPRVALGHAAVAAGVRCGIDVSDGLLQDLGHIAERSGVGIEVDLDAVPVHREAAAELGAERALDLALGGGEDFELLLAGPEATLLALATPEVPVTVIGRVVPAHPRAVWAVRPDGSRYEPSVVGWDQLRAGPA